MLNFSSEVSENKDIIFPKFTYLQELHLQTWGTLCNLPHEVSPDSQAVLTQALDPPPTSGVGQVTRGSPAQLCGGLPPWRHPPLSISCLLQLVVLGVPPSLTTLLLFSLLQDGPDVIG